MEPAHTNIALTRNDALGLLGLLVLATVRAWPSWGTTVDDAWISGRYALQLAHGNGPVYNAGQPAIEGFTNPLWTAWLVPAHWLGIDLHTFVEASGLAFGLLAVTLMVVAARALTRDRWAPWLAGGLLALDPHLGISTTNGLETSMFVAWTLGAFTLLARRSPVWLTALFCGLGLWIRPEGALVGGVVALALASRLPLKRAILALATSAIPIATMVVWRAGTYGTWVPNTFAAKAAGSVGSYLSGNFNYLYTSWPHWAFVVTGLLLALFGLRHSKQRALRLAAIVSTVGMAAAAMRVYLWMPGARLLVPGAALIMLLTAIAPGRLARAVSLGWLTFLLVCPFTSIETRLRRADTVHSVDLPNDVQRVMQHVAPHLPDGSWVSTRDAGVLAYYAGSKVHVAETHQRALTQPHPEGADADVLAYTPTNPAMVVMTTRGERSKKKVYRMDHRILKRTTVPYRYLGRVRQHHRRHYDLYLRADIDVPEPPKTWFKNRLGYKPPER